MPDDRNRRPARSRDRGDGAGALAAIVGVGASAGGLQALEKVFGAMPADSGLGFVVVQHLHPERESHMAELLSRHTALSVIPVEEGVRVEPDHVYLILPDRELTISDGILHLAKMTSPRGSRRPIDGFFNSLAEDQTERAIGMILSGTGSDGSAGIKTIKASGGLTAAQHPDSAQYPDMPRNAIATGMVDVVLPPEQLPGVLVDYARHPYLAAREPEGAEDAAPRLGRLLSLLQARTGRDFRLYKKSTLMRRIHRRMGLKRVGRLADYESLLRGDANEAGALAKDLMINVTGFMRDPEAWQTLKTKVIVPLVRDRDNGGPIRIWIPACATGEEAYSVAMLLAEQAEAAQKTFDVKIFATDTIDENLSTARRGLFSATIERDVSDERMQRFFEPVDDSYQVRRELRDWVVFAPQNLLQDPPFFRVDLVSCRNFLIYLEEEAQRRVIRLFHFALREGGHLFLGNAETVGRDNDLFETVSKKWRIYRRVGPTRHDIIDFPTRAGAEARSGADPAAAATLASSHSAEIAQRMLADRYGPAAVLIDRNHRIHYFHGRTEDYLTQPSGEPTRDLLAMAREGLRTKLRSAVRAAIRESHEVTFSTWVTAHEQGRPVAVTVSPVANPEPGGAFLITFREEVKANPRPVGETGAPEDVAQPVPVARDARIEHEFEAELRDVRAELGRTIEDLETANEELKASNEEITSMNEEFQSANEELETSKEELQSLNEELNTVNSQLQHKVEELELTTNDLTNLLSSTDIATLFLDRELRIRFFTPAMGKLIDIIRTDVGRSIHHFAARFDDPDLARDAKEVLDKLMPAEAEVQRDDRRWYLRRTLPYRTQDDRINGVVVTFTDVTAGKLVEQQSRSAHEHMQRIYDTVREPLLVLHPDLRVRSANASFYDTFRARPDETEGRLVYDLGDRQWDIQALRELLSDILPENATFDDFEVALDLEHLGQRTMRLNARRLDEVQLILLAIEDVTEEKQAEERQQMLLAELTHRVKNVLATVQSIASQTVRSAPSLDEFQAAFAGRLQALSQGHALLTRSHWEGASLRDTIEELLAAHQTVAGRIQLSGEDLGLRPQAAVALSLIVYELATNAVKYGALSRRSGRVEITWQLTGSDLAPEVRLLWSESGGPAVEPPAKAGFGLTLIERGVAHELDGRSDFAFRREGFRCELVMPYNRQNFRSGKPTADQTSAPPSA